MTVTTNQDRTGIRLGPQTYIVDVTPSVSGVAQLAEQILKQYTLPIGLLRRCRYFCLQVVPIKSGTTDAATAITVRLGTAGTVADTSILSHTSLGAAQRQSNFELWLTATTATNLSSLTAVKGNSFSGAGTAVTYPQDTTVANMDTNALFLSISATMAGTNDTPQIARVILTLYP